MNYLLDTDSVSYAIRGQGQVAERIRLKLPSELAISSITYAELIYGAEKRASSKLTRSIDNFTSQIEIVPFGSDSAVHFGKIAAFMANDGISIGQFDTLIAAHALAMGYILVTNNVRHFSRVPGLRLENWA